jgi:hypothetical protein
MIGYYAIGALRPINGPEIGAHTNDVISKSFYPDYRLESDIFWRFVEDANSAAFKILAASGATSFFAFPVYSSLSILGGNLFCVLTDSDDTTFTLRCAFEDIQDKTV